MISISCTNCKTVLTIDEAFAGGVCRCQHCGTIQTVPAGARGGQEGGLSGGSLSGQSLGGSKVNLPRQSTGTGLDDLADIVASSGLAGSGLSSRRLSRGNVGATSSPAPATKRRPVAAIVAGGVVALLGFVAFLALRGGGEDDATSTQQAGSNVVALADDDGASAVAAVRGPSFAGVPLEGNTIIYVLDRGSGTREVFELMKVATLRSIGSLGNDRKFQIIFWHGEGAEEAVFPKTGPAYATDKRIDETRRELDNLAAYGSTAAGPALELAYGHSPDAVVLATGKGPDLSDDFTAEVEAARKAAKAPIHTFSLGAGGSDVLKAIAERTKGQYKQVTLSQLDALTR